MRIIGYEEYSNMQLGELVKQKRLQLGLTQTGLADMLGVGQTYITFIEKDKRTPSNDILLNLAKALRLSFKKLYGLAHPDLKNMVNFRTSVATRELPLHLQNLAADKLLREKFSITDQDISMLGSIQARGETRNKDDYIVILMTIRNAFTSR